MKCRIGLLFGSFLLASSVNAQPSPTVSHRPNLVTEQWQYSITPYVWAMGIRGSVSHNGTSLGQVSLSPGSVLSDLKMAGMVIGQAHKGRLGFYLDAIYGDLGKTNSVVKGRADLSANTKIQMSMVTFAPSYTLYNSPSLYLDGLIGVRYFWQKASTTISAQSLPGSITENSTLNLTAGVAGVKGRFNLGSSDYFVPFYLDVGAGQSSSFTSQAYLAVGRSFDWGEVTLGVKNVYYQFKPNVSNIDMNMFGAALGVTFRF